VNRLLLAAMLVAVALGLGWGFSVVGGPEHARKEQRDARRASDLADLGRYHQCRLRQDPRRAGDGTPIACTSEGATERTDPSKGEAYRFAETGEGRFEVCATFELAGDDRDDMRRYDVRFEGREGCLRFRRDGAGWVRD
jgi:hypothetical protein